MQTRRGILNLLGRGMPALPLLLGGPSSFAAPGGGFDGFLAGLQSDAARHGISRATFASAFTGLTPDPAVIAAMRREPEYGKPMGAYMASLVSPARITAGQRKSAQWADTLQAIEQRFGVDPNILVSIWGIESAFGEAHDPWDVFRSLATLAYARFQQPLFRNELISALTILQGGGIPRRQFLGSWAGAMGQTQFLPSSYLKYAVHFGGDGRPDIWTRVPDVLASIANYLHQEGWQPGLPWGFEVTAPRGFDYRTSRGTFRQWAGKGFGRADGQAFPDSGEAILFFPSGSSGPAFLVKRTSSSSRPTTIPTHTRLRSANCPTGCADAVRFAPLGRSTISSLRAASVSRSSAGSQRSVSRSTISRVTSISRCATTSDRCSAGSE